MIDLYTSSSQEVFDYILDGIRKQGGPSIKSDGLSSACMYRGDNGRKCAVGLCIPDELYIPAMEGLTLTELWDDKEEIHEDLHAGIHKHTPLLCALQDAHDYSFKQASQGIDFFSFFENACENTATLFDLQYKAPRHVD